MSATKDQTRHLYYVNPEVAKQDAEVLGLKVRSFNGHWVEVEDKRGAISKRKKKIAAIIEGPETHIHERSTGPDGEWLLHYDDDETTWS